MWAASLRDLGLREKQSTVRDSWGSAQRALVKGRHILSRENCSHTVKRPHPNASLAIVGLPTLPAPCWHSPEAGSAYVTHLHRTHSQTPLCIPCQKRELLRPGQGNSVDWSIAQMCQACRFDQSMYRNQPMNAQIGGTANRWFSFFL